MHKRFWPLLLLFVLVVIAAVIIYSMSTDEDESLAGRDKITLQLQWTPQAQFVGFYVAKAKGFYAEEGLAVDFLHGGPNVDPIKNLTSGDAEIALSTADQVLVRTDQNNDSNRDLKAIGTVYNQSLAGFMSKKSQNIKTPQDLRGKTIGVFPSYDTEHLLMALLQKFDIKADEVKIVNYPTLPQFESGDVDIYGAYIINEPIWAKQKGIEYDFLKPSDYGVEFYSDTIITTKSYYSENADILKRFLRASSKGWSYAQQNPEEAVILMYEVVKGSIGEGQPKEHQIGMCQSAVNYLRAGPDSLNFFMEKSKWDKMEAHLYSIGRLNKTGHISSLCDFDIVEEALK